MPTVTDHPKFQIEAHEMAKWLKSQPDSWWIVDGDPVLTATVDFPCPSSELAEAIEKQRAPLVIYSPKGGASAAIKLIDASKVQALSDTRSRSGGRAFLCRWLGSEDVWLLVEDPAAAFAG